MLVWKDPDGGNIKKDKSHPRAKRLLLFVLLCITEALLLSFLSLVLYWRGVRVSSPEPREQTICVQCTDIGITTETIPAALQGMMTISQNGDSEGSKCCGKTSAILDCLVSQAIKTRDKSYNSDFDFLTSEKCKQIKETVPSAQMNGISESEMAKGESDVILWNTTGESFLTEGVTYVNGRLSVKKAGYYYIFSQLKLGRASCVKLGSGGDDVNIVHEELQADLGHYIYRHSTTNGVTQTILEGSKSRCEIQQEHDVSTSATGAVFYLTETDEIFVKTSHQQNLVPSQEGNHFGLYFT